MSPKALTPIVALSPLEQLKQFKAECSAFAKSSMKQKADLMALKVLLCGQYKTACELLGHSYAIHNTWMAKGKDGDPNYKDYAQCVAGAKALFELGIVQELLASGQISAKIYILERMNKATDTEQAQTTESPILQLLKNAREIK